MGGPRPIVIVAVTLNPALDLTYELDTLVPAATNRVDRASARAGGKAVNVARVLARQGYAVHVLGFVGGATGAVVADELTASGIAHQLIPVGGETRRTIAVWARADDEVTLLNEPGPPVAAAEWNALVDRLRASSPNAVVLSGSVPPGLANEAYAELVAVARSIGAVVVLDTDGPALLPGVAARPDIVKPNRDELIGATGVESVREAAEMLRSHGAVAVVASLGSDGLMAVTPEGSWRARSQPVSGNATGAGDACVAGLVIGAVEDRPWPDRLLHAASLGAAAVSPHVALTTTIEEI